MLDGATQELPLDKTLRQRFVKKRSSILPVAEDSATAECTKEEPRWWWRPSQGLRVDIHCRRYDKFLGWRNFCANSYWFWYRLAPIRGSQKSSSPREWNAKSESVKRSHVLMVVYVSSVKPNLYWARGQSKSCYYKTKILTRNFRLRTRIYHVVQVWRKSIEEMLFRVRSAQNEPKHRPGHRQRPTVEKAKYLLLKFVQLSVQGSSPKVKASTFLLNYQNLSTLCLMLAVFN